MTTKTPNPKRKNLWWGITSIVIAPLIAMAVAVFVWKSTGLRPPNCDVRDVVSRATSPGGSRIATVFYNVCNDGFLVTMVSFTIELQRPGDAISLFPSRESIFGMDGGVEADRRILAVAWKDENHLEVTLPNDAYLA